MKTYEVQLQFNRIRKIKANNEDEALEKAFTELSKECKDEIYSYFVDNSYAIEQEDDTLDFIERVSQ